MHSSTSEPSPSPVPSRRTLTAWVEETADSRGEHLVVSDEGRSLTGRELDDQAQRLAGWLRRQGVLPGDFIGISMTRSVDLAVGLLAILKCGAAYVPMDPEYPAERLSFMLKDCGAAWLLAERAFAGRWEGVSEVILDDPGAAWRDESAGAAFDPVDAESPAYMIYTSGSTGQPKGVVVPHRAIVASLEWLVRTFDFARGDAVLQKAPISFDFSVWEIFLPLVAGGRLVFAKPGGQQDPKYLAQLMNRESIAWAFFVPSMLRLFLDKNPGLKLPSLRHVFCSGEPLPVDVERAFLAVLPARLHNVYGPTEAAVEVTHWECRPGWNGEAVPIGHPFPGVEIHLLSDDLQPVGAGSVGEICIGGGQVASGYHRRPDLTAARFVDDPFSGRTGARLYRTGDLGRRDADGVLFCLGRMDHQIKLRGFRIELGEIESALSSHPAVRQAVVAVRHDGEPRLVAYLLESENGRVGTAELRRHLLTVLPDYMVPSRWVWLAAFPLNPSGKIDRGALPPPPRERSLPPETWCGPRTPTEKKLATIWNEILELDGIGIDDPFFEAGGDSLGVARMQERVEEIWAAGLGVAELFEFTTIRKLAARIDRSSVGLSPIDHAAERAQKRREAGLRRARILNVR